MTESYIQYEWTLKTLRNSNKFKSVDYILEVGDFDCVFLVTFRSVLNFLGTAVAQWLRFCATNRKVAGSIPAGVIGIFH